MEYIRASTSLGILTCIEIIIAIKNHYLGIGCGKEQPGKGLFEWDRRSEGGVLLDRLYSHRIAPVAILHLVSPGCRLGEVVAGQSKPQPVNLVDRGQRDRSGEAARHRTMIRMIVLLACSVCTERLIEIVDDLLLRSYTVTPSTPPVGIPVRLRTRGHRNPPSPASGTRRNSADTVPNTDDRWTYAVRWGQCGSKSPRPDVHSHTGNSG